MSTTEATQQDRLTYAGLSRASTADLIRDDIETHGSNSMTLGYLTDLADRRGVDLQACVAYADFYASIGDRLVTETEAAKLRGLAAAIENR